MRHTDRAAAQSADGLARAIFGADPKRAVHVVWPRICRSGRWGAAGRITWVDAALLEYFGLDPDILHLNHGAFGVSPVAVRRVAAAWRDRAERNPHRFNRVELPPLIAAARERVAGFLGVDPSCTAWEVAPVHFDGTGYLRVAAAPYNTSDDYDRLADAVRDLLKRW